MEIKLISIQKDYPGQTILHDISIDVNPANFIAITGDTGGCLARGLCNDACADDDSELADTGITGTGPDRDRRDAAGQLRAVGGWRYRDAARGLAQASAGRGRV